MYKNNLETKAIKSVLNIEKKVQGIYDILADLSSKLCHIIKNSRSYYDMLRGDE